jgi:adenylate cyclase
MVQERAQRRLAAILVADVVGYSRLMEADEAGTLAALKDRRARIIEPLVTEHQGRVFKQMGDSVLIEFASAVNAVDCAIDLQKAMAAAGSADKRRIQLRVGVNLGDIIVEGSDLYGEGVNIAARLEALAEPGGILVSETVVNHVRGKVSVAFHDRGEQILKNIAQPVRTYGVAGETAVALPGTAAESTHAAWPSIAVLPFTNLSSDAEQQYFADGITEDIITELSRYRTLRVTARNSSFQFRGPAVDIPAVRRALGARYVVEGSVRKMGHRLRVTAQLIDAVTQNHIWAERYDRDIQDIFAVQDDVTRTIVASLEGSVAASGAEHARRKPAADWVAYDFVLQGRECLHRYQVAEAEPLFARAAELDSDYAPAHAGRAIALGDLYLLDERQETLNAAIASAKRALALGENDPWAHRAMGFVALRNFQLELAGMHFNRAISLNPNDVDSAYEHANWLSYVGKFGEALSALDAVQRRDPFPPTWVSETRGQTLYCVGRFEEAILAFRAVRPQHYWVPGFIAACYANMGRMEEARRELDLFLKGRPGATVGLLAKRLSMAGEMRERLLAGFRKAGLPE